MRIVTGLLLAAVVGGAQVGCTSPSRDFVAPRITVEKVVALSGGGGQPRFQVTLMIDNTNTKPLPVYSFEFKLRLADQGIIDGALPQSVTIDPLDQLVTTLELSSDIVSSLSRLLSFVQGPDNLLPYEIYGTLRLDRTVRDPIPFSFRGQTPISTTSQP
jgi:LEA14-like dessication related protein